MFGKEPHPMDMEPLPKALKPKKTAVQLPKRSEQDVKTDILSLLNRHPKIAMVKRVNSGAMQLKNRFVKFNSVRVNGHQDVRMVDIECLLKDGRTLAIECKEPAWEEPDWEFLNRTDAMLSEKQARELAQRRYLQIVVSSGGIGVFANDVDAVIKVLEEV